MDYEEEDDFILQCFQLQQWMLVMIATTIVENHFFEWIALGERLPAFPGCIGHIDGTLCRIRRPWNDENGTRRIRVEWGIGGLKVKFKRFLKTFDNRKSRFNHMFRTGCILTNFIQRKRGLVEYEDLGPYQSSTDAPEDTYGLAE
ncbi:hypothetical protein R1flu_002263 [Riccia fluitans]|uniref:DDE Tnp4 domain-containing protein n=1 Tax=Riccia fluitans TaxID=41844 RepID=A0ABD1Y5L0_9MARC